MSNLQIIEALTGIVYKQNEIIHAQAEALAQVAQYAQRTRLLA